MKSIPTGARLFAAALLIYSVCPPFTSYDSYYVVPSALQLLHHGTMAVDPYVPSAPPVSSYAVFYVPPRPGSPGHYYNWFSPGVAVLASPLIGIIEIATRASAALFPHAREAAPHPIIGAFLAGDLIGGRAIVELLCAAFIGALSVWFQYRIARRLASQRRAVGLTLLFAFGTAEWSVASRNLGQHGLSVLLLSAALYLAVLARERPRLIAYASIPLALSFTVRPSNCVAVAVFTVYVAVHYRAELWRFLAWAAPIAAIFLVNNLVVLHSLFPPYYGMNSPTPYPQALGLALNLVSPARGVFVFTPVFLFACAGIWLAIRRRWLFPLAPYLAGILLLHEWIIAPYWAGHSYGPRYFSDMGPIFILFLIPAVEHWRKMLSGGRRAALAGIFLLFCSWGVFVHARGATSLTVHWWNTIPNNVDEHMERVWDWSDPPFLRGLR